MSSSDTGLEVHELERYTPFTPFEESYAFEPEAAAMDAFQERVRGRR